MEMLKRLVKNPYKIVFGVVRIVPFLSKLLPDKAFLKLQFRSVVGQKLDLKNPVTFNQKIQWLKVYDRKPEYTIMVDKYEVKKYVADKIGKQYIIPTIGVWNSFDEINFNNFPKQFVLKCTHDSGGLVICKDITSFDFEEARKKLTNCLKNNFYWIGREWPYKNVKPRIIAEEYLSDQGRIVPEDYKIYCFNGKPKFIVVFHNRFQKEQKLSETVYDINWIPQGISLDQHFEVSDVYEPAPLCLNEMLFISEQLSKGMSQSRIDFYVVNDKLKLGEITLYTAGGLQPMIPESMDEELGKLIDLSLIKK